MCPLLKVLTLSSWDTFPQPIVLWLLLRQREKSAKRGANVSFSIKNFLLEWKSRSGTRKEEVGFMMWEAEYYTWGQTPEGGNKTKSELEVEWRRMVDDESVAKDFDGPKGYLRCYVSTQTRIVKFSEISQDRTLQFAERLGKKASDEALQARAEWALGGAGLEQHTGLVDWDGANAKMASGLEAVTAPDVRDMLGQLKRKSRKGEGEAKSDEEGEEDEEEEEEKEKENEKAGQDRKKAKAWFDADIKVVAAERSYLARVKALRGTLEETLTAMNQGLERARRHPNTKVRPCLHRAECPHLKSAEFRKIAQPLSNSGQLLHSDCHPSLLPLCLASCSHTPSPPDYSLAACTLQ